MAAPQGALRAIDHALALFGAGSLACAYASLPGTFIAAWVLLGLRAVAKFPLARRAHYQRREPQVQLNS